KKKHWGLLFTNVPPGQYAFTLDEPGGTPATQTIRFRVSSVFAVPTLDIFYPQDNDPVDLVFFPYGVTSYEISYIWFFDYPRYDIYGDVLLQADATSDFWFGIVDNPSDPGSGLEFDYDLEVRNLDPMVLTSTLVRTGLTIP